MVTITPKASDKLKELMASENREEEVLRLAIAPGGCSGFSYRMGFDGRRDNDIVAHQNGIEVAIDPLSAQHLEGVEVDWVESLMGGGFAIKNPKAVSSCGCGQSFHTHEQEGHAHHAHGNGHNGHREECT